MGNSLYERSKKGRGLPANLIYIYKNSYEDRKQSEQNGIELNAEKIILTIPYDDDDEDKKL